MEVFTHAIVAFLIAHWQFIDALLEEVSRQQIFQMHFVLFLTLFILTHIDSLPSKGLPMSPIKFTK